MNLDPAVSAWCDRVADFFVTSGQLPPIAGRTIAWLMICDPAEQSAAQIAEFIGASRASLTSTLRLLGATGIVQRSSRPGERTAYYRIADEAWASALRQRFAVLGSFLNLVREARELVGPERAGATRLDAAEELYGWLNDEIGPLWQRWDARHRQEG